MSTDKPAGRRPGMTSFGDDDGIPIPTAAQMAAAKATGAGLGFVSEKPAPIAEKTKAGGNGRASIYTANFHIRTRPEDRQRYDDFAYRHRVNKGEAMRRLLDLAEAQEAAQSAKTGS